METIEFYYWRKVDGHTALSPSQLEQLNEMAVLSCILNTEQYEYAQEMIKYILPENNKATNGNK